MLKRLAAFLFIFAIAGQVYAGVCVCLGGDKEAAHSCCKREKEARDSISGKAGCETDCAASPAGKPVIDRIEPAAKIKFQAVQFSPAVPRISFENIRTGSSVPIRPFADHRLKYARPPDLYLRHHAFLI